MGRAGSGVETPLAPHAANPYSIRRDGAEMSRVRSAPQRLVRRINHISAARPGLGLRLAALSGVALRSRLGEAWWPSSHEIEAMLGTLDARPLRRLQGRLSACQLRNRAVQHLLRHRGIEPLRGLIRVRGVGAFERLRAAGPVAVVHWHAGVVRGVETALHGRGYPILAATAVSPVGPDPGYRWALVNGRSLATRYLAEAMRGVKRGVVPVLSLDGHMGAGARELTFLGQSIAVHSGAGVLARRADARLVPATSRWVGLSSRIEVTLHEPLPEPDRSVGSVEEWQDRIVESGVRWFEERLRAHPEDLRIVSMRMMLERTRNVGQAPSDEDFARLAEAFDAGGPG